MRRSRRTFLADLGRTTAGLVVLGPVLAACGDAETPGEVVGGSTPDGTSTPSGTATSGGTSTPGGADTPGATAPSLVDLGFVAAYVLVRGGEAALVDTGVAGSEQAIAEVLAGLGLAWGDVGHVIATHDHPDHVGGLAAVADLAADAVLYGGAADIPDMAAPRDVVAVGDGDRVFDLTIVATPGHTPGHLSVLDPVGRFVVVGDALVGDGAGGLAGPDARFTDDMATAVESVRRLAGLDVDEVLVGHGFPTAGAGRAALEALAAAL